MKPSAVSPSLPWCPHPGLLSSAWRPPEIDWNLNNFSLVTNYSSGSGRGAHWRRNKHSQGAGRGGFCCVQILSVFITHLITSLQQIENENWASNASLNELLGKTKATFHLSLSNTQTLELDWLFQAPAAASSLFDENWRLLPSQKRASQGKSSPIILSIITLWR